MNAEEYDAQVDFGRKRLGEPDASPERAVRASQYRGPEFGQGQTLGAWMMAASHEKCCPGFERDDRPDGSVVEAHDFECPMLPPVGSRYAS